MNYIAYIGVFLLSYYTVQGRSYGYGKKKLKPDPVPVPVGKLPLCNVGCTRQWIPLECREETYGFENGVKCKSCDRDICKGSEFIGGDNIGLDSWQNGRNWQDSSSFENSRIFNQRRNSGFIDNLQDIDLAGLGRRPRFSNNGFFGNNNWDTVQNRQFGNQW